MYTTFILASTSFCLLDLETTIFSFYGSRLMLSQQLPELAKIGEFSLEKFGYHTDGKLPQIFTKLKAVYHKSCILEYNA